jgi:hypothetical protein
MVDSGIDYAVFNAVVLSATLVEPEVLEDLLRLAASHYSARRMSWSCWLCEDMLGARVRPVAWGAVARAGLRLVAEHQGMIADQVAGATRLLPRLVFRQVRDAQTRQDFQQIISRVFALPSNVSRHVYGSERFWRGGYIGWVGYAGGKPVTTAATESAAGSVGVYSVATVAEEQGKGYAEAITRHCLEEARRASGLSRTSLQSTSAGYRLYSRMGYRQVTRVRVYVAN